MALTRIGHMMISNMSEGTKSAQHCTLHYPICRDAVLRAHPWNFAIRRATLGLSAVAPNHEYTYQHVLPDDCLKVIRTDFEANGYSGAAVYGFPGQMGYSSDLTPYRIESAAGIGKVLLCDNDTVKIEYIAKITDVAMFDDLFVDVLAQRLAAEIAVAFTDTQTMAKAMWDIYSEKLREARTIDAQEGTPRDVVDLSPWIAARA